MSSRSLSRTRTLRGRTTTATARTIALGKRTESGTADTRTPPSEEAFRRTVEAGICPWCLRGPFQVLALHTSRKHDVTSKELHDLAGLTYQTSLTSDEYYERRVEVARSNMTPEHLEALAEGRKQGAGKKRTLSMAGRRSQREKVLNQTAEARARAVRLTRERHVERHGERDQRIVDQVQAGQDTYETIAEQHGLNPRTIARIARRHGVHIDGRARPAKAEISRRLMLQRSGADVGCSDGEQT